MVVEGLRGKRLSINMRLHKTAIGTGSKCYFTWPNTCLVPMLRMI